MPTSIWGLSLAELLFYTPCTIPTTYVLWKHRHTGVEGWFFLLVFLSLQIVGSGMIVGVGQHGTPSTTAIIITEIGLSPLILCLAGAVHEWSRLVGAFRTIFHQRIAVVLLVVYHLAIGAAVAIYAIGASNAAENPPQHGAKGVKDAGIVLILLLYLALFAAFGFLARRVGTEACRPLFWAIAVSFVLLGIRVVYQCIATFDDGAAFNPVTGQIAFAAVLEFLPAALIIVAMVTGGVVTIGRETTDREPAMEMARYRANSTRAETKV